jgi:hypothetical protein
MLEMGVNNLELQVGKQLSVSRIYISDIFLIV